MTVAPISSNSIPATQLQGALDELHRGSVVAFPTETVYGLGADATNQKAIEYLYEVKGRPANRPLTVHLADIDDIPQWAAEIPAGAERLIEHFCPGPLTLVLPRRPQVLDIVTAGSPSVGIRLPSHPMARQLIRAFGIGLVAPSANRSGYLSPTSAKHVRQEFGELVPIVIDGGECALGIESTIVDFSHEKPRLLRLGLLSADLLQEVAGTEIEAAPTQPEKAGERHYQPRTPAEICANSAIAERCAELLAHPGHQIAVLYHTPETVLPQSASLHAIELPDDPTSYAQRLYANLRYLDGCCLEAVLIEDVPAAPSWNAVRDRINKVATL